MAESPIDNPVKNSGITAIIVKGYKAIADEVTVEIAPLTILAGANSSGKSSIMQPLLLMKQTLQAPYDPGALLLNGGNVKFTSARQLFNRNQNSQVNEFDIGIELDKDVKLISTFSKTDGKPLDLDRIEIGYDKLIEIKNTRENRTIIYDRQTGYKDVYKILERVTEKTKNLSFAEMFKALAINTSFMTIDFLRKRCFLECNFSWLQESEESETTAQRSTPIEYTQVFIRYIQSIIHVPGLRGNPERNYQVTAIGSDFPGLFDNYVASIITSWQSGEDPSGKQNLEQLNYYLNRLRLTNKIQAKPLNDTQVEIMVDRLPCAKDNRNGNSQADFVSIADVGFGVSQTLPVLVALITAVPGQLVYIEQPEIHLHPKAIVAIAEAFADAAKRGVKVVVETHSELFLTSVQSLVAEDYLSAELVKLHWFTRRDDGTTKIDSANLDDVGRFGDWTEDFADIALNLQNRYLTAADRKLWSH